MEVHNYHASYFVVSVPTISCLPNDEVNIEIAFVGRSNSGKSSVINALTNQKKLAKVSRTPGSTKFINLFEIKPGIRLIDFPGYGYSKKIKIKNNWWLNIVCQYLMNRKNLKGLVLITDIRHAIKNFDYIVISHAVGMNIPVLALLNKSDKISKSIQKMTLCLLQQKIKMVFPKLQFIKIEIFSSLKKNGIESLKKILDYWLSH